MGDRSPRSAGLCLCQECKQDAAPRAKRLSDAAAQVQHLQSAKKMCVLGHVCSTPSAPHTPLLHSPGPACSHFLEESGHGDLAAGFSASKYNDVNISLDTSRCFDDSELDDSLLELSGSEKGNSPFDYTEEEIQEILADDCVEAEQHLIRGSRLSQNVNGESSSCSGASGSEEEPLPQEYSPGSSGCYPGFLSGSAGLDVTHLQQDLELQDLLSLSPFTTGGSSEPPGDSCLVEAMIDDCLGDATAAGGCVLKESSVPEGQESLERSMPSPDLTRDQSTGDESSASGSGKKELPKTTKTWFSRKSGSPEKEERESPGAEQPSGSIKSSDKALGQTGQEETTSGKKPGKVIPVPQKKEERLKQRTCISEVELEQKKHLYPECAHPYGEKCSSYIRNYSRPNKKAAKRYSHAQWVSKNLAKHHFFQNIPDCFQC